MQLSLKAQLLLAQALSVAAHDGLTDGGCQAGCTETTVATAFHASHPCPVMLPACSARRRPLGCAGAH